MTRQLQCIAMTRRAALPRRRDSSVEPTRGYGRLINNGLQLEEVENCRELAGGHAAIAEQLQAYADGVRTECAERQAHESNMPCR